MMSMGQSNEVPNVSIGMLNLEFNPIPNLLTFEAIEIIWRLISPVLHLVILQEAHQINLNEKFSKIFSEVSDSQDVTIEVKYVSVHRERLDESLVKGELK